MLQGLLRILKGDVREVDTGISINTFQMYVGSRTSTCLVLCEQTESLCIKWCAVQFSLATDI